MTRRSIDAQVRYVKRWHVHIVRAALMSPAPIPLRARHRQVVQRQLILLIPVDKGTSEPRRKGTERGRIKQSEVERNETKQIKCTVIIVTGSYSTRS